MSELDKSLSDEVIPRWEDIALNPPVYPDAQARASRLILQASIGISKSGSTLTYTNGSMDVVKCGFKEVIIQRRANNSNSWADWVSYEDLYADDSIYTLSKSLVVTWGYQYRVICVHYTKKNIFSVQKFDNVSNTLTFCVF
ncbi:MAG: hypothetical protein IJ261_02475 [Clostridia bacterium]|nr:hypothetical protein [Clostridia bacterium]